MDREVGKSTLGIRCCSHALFECLQESHFCLWHLDLLEISSKGIRHTIKVFGCHGFDEVPRNLLRHIRFWRRRPQRRSPLLRHASSSPAVIRNAARVGGRFYSVVTLRVLRAPHLRLHPTWLLGVLTLAMCILIPFD